MRHVGTEAENERISGEDDALFDLRRNLATWCGVDDVNRVFGELDIRVVDAEEHEVDYDEAFVQVVQRHRSAQDGSIEDRTADQTDGTSPSAAGTTGDATPDDGTDDDATDVETSDVETSDGGAS